MADTFVCARCGREHEGPPLAYDFPDAPASVVHMVAGPDDLAKRSRVGDETYVVDDEWFWVKAIVELPVDGSAEALVFGVWVRVEPDVLEALERVLDGGDATAFAFEGRLDTVIWPYRNALELPVHLVYASPEDRPNAVVVDEGHALGRDQRDGIPLDRVREFAERIAHMDEELEALARGEELEFYE